MMPMRITLMCLFSTALLWAQSSTQNATGSQPGPETQQTTTQKLPTAESGFDITSLDTTAKPCVDFYQYACGTWMKRNPIPASEARWGRFNELAERNRLILRDILEKAAVPDPKRDSVTQKIGDFYTACMDEKEIDRKGAAPIKDELARIAALSDKKAIVDEVARLHRNGVNVFFDFSSGPDEKNSTQEIGQADQGGLGLPDRDYYFRPEDEKLRKEYEQHVAKMFQLIGVPAEQAEANAATVLQIETGLAKGALDLVSRRNPENTYHKLTEQEFADIAPAFDWRRYFVDMGAPPIQSLNVREPEFFKQMQALFEKTSLEQWKTYMQWHVLHSAAPLLSAAFVNENFDFYGRTLSGTQELRPRWKRCVSYTDGDLGEALGQKYVDRTFGVEGKQRTLMMVHEIEQAMSRDLQQLTWMTPETKQKALVKLHEVTNKIGYPDKWRDYSSVNIARDDAFGNDLRATEFEVHRQIAKIGKPVDRSEWTMTPPTVNAYYNPEENNINFPAGILQPPFYDNHIDDAVNYGAIGAVVGHELTHGFDDQGRRFDGQGNMRNWWQPEDAKAFEERASCLVNEYSSFVPVDDVHLNGKLTLGENTADNGGLRLSYMALMAKMSLEKSSTPEQSKIDGFTPEQRFFLGWGQTWCQNVRDAEALRLARTDPHSPGRFRANGVVQNMPEFQKAFGCQAGQPMVRKPECRVW